MRLGYRYGLVVLLSFLQIFIFCPESWARDVARSEASARGHPPAKKNAVKKRAASTAKARTTNSKPHKHLANKRVQKPKKLAPVRGKVARKSARKPAKTRQAANRAIRKTDLAGMLNASSALVFNPATSEVLFEKNADDVLPIASITKLMTALVVLDAHQPLDEMLTITPEDVDRIKHTSSRLGIGSRLTRANMLHIALMSSENRAASALGRHYPGGVAAFVGEMNRKAQALGMTDTRYVEPTGLSSENVSSARDLAKLVLAAKKYPLIRQYSTHDEHEVEPGGRALHYRNSNRLIARADWDIVLQKTGYISEAGRCLVMHAIIDSHPVIMVLLNAHGKQSRAADAGTIRHWLEIGKLPMM